MSRKRRDNAAELKERLKQAAQPVQPPAVAVGVDVTWWGGSRKANRRQSPKECIASALKVESGWGLPEFRRVELPRINPKAGEYEPNADPDGGSGPACRKSIRYG